MTKKKKKKNKHLSLFQIKAVWSDMPDVFPQIFRSSEVKASSCCALNDE